MKATLIKSRLTGFTGEASLYRLEPPLDGHEYVVVSATVVPYSGPETYVFAASDEGEISDWGELEGSYRGGLSIDEALRGAGYEVQK